MSEKGKGKDLGHGLGFQQGLEAKEEAEAVAIRGCSKQSLSLPQRQSEEARLGRILKGRCGPFSGGYLEDLEGLFLGELPSLGRHCVSTLGSVSERQLSTL